MISMRWLYLWYAILFASVSIMSAGHFEASIDVVDKIIDTCGFIAFTGFASYCYTKWQEIK